VNSLEREGLVGVEIRFISGMMLGIEIIHSQDKNVLIIDLVILRLLVFRI